MNNRIAIPAVGLALTAAVVSTANADCPLPPTITIGPGFIGSQTWTPDNVYALDGQVYLSPVFGPESLDELARRRDAGFVMIKLWQSTPANDPRNFPIFEAAIEYGMPVLIHTFVYQAEGPAKQTTPTVFAEAARRYPECTFQMAHMAGDFVSGIEAVIGLGNVYVDF